jgi:hypothetical protein
MFMLFRNITHESLCSEPRFPRSSNEREGNVETQLHNYKSVKRNSVETEPPDLKWMNTSMGLILKSESTFWQIETHLNTL